MSSERPSVFRPGDVSYLRIPAPDPGRLASFYEEVFGWRSHGSPDGPGFEDATGHLIGHFSQEHEVAGEAGIRPYVYVDDVARTLDEIVARDGAVVTATYREGNLLVAVFRDPAGNVVGVWQRASV